MKRIDIFRQLLRSAWRELRKQKLRSLLSVLGIVFGVAAVISMLAVAEGAKRETLRQIAGLGADSILLRNAVLTPEQKKAAASNRSRGLSDLDVASVERLFPAVEGSAAIREIASRIAAPVDGTVYQVFAVSPSFAALNGLRPQQGRFICPLDQHLGQRVCVIGAEVSAGLGDGGRIGATVQIEKRPFTEVGVLANREQARRKNSSVAVRNYNRAVFIPLGTEPAAVPASDPGYSELVFRFDDRQTIAAAARMIHRIVLNNHGGFEDFQTIVPIELLRQANRAQRTFNVILGTIAAITLLVGGIGIMNIMTASVTERTREIGIRRAVGANRRHIVSQFITESTLLTLIGGVIGFFLGAIGAFVVQWAAEWPVFISGWSVCTSFGVSSLAGICFGIYPAYKAAMMNPVDALRY